MSDEELPAFWEDLGLPGLADIHVHFLPEKMLHKVWAYFDSAEENYGTSWPIAYRWSQPERLALLRKVGLRAIPALTYPHKPGMAEWLNGWTAELASDHPDVIHCATFHPEPEAGDYVRSALDSGAQLFKAHVQIGEYDPNHELLEPIWEALEDSRTPVVIHAGSAPLAGTYTGAQLIGGLLARHPGLVLVIAHMGMPEYHEFADLAEKYDGVHLDTTLAFTAFAENFAPVPEGYPARLAGLQEKVVLGTDFPHIPHPYAAQIQALVDLGLGEDWLRSVLWHNGARLLHLE